MNPSSIRARPGLRAWLLLWLLGVNLRLTLLVVPPLLPLIHRDLGLSETQVGALTGATTLLFAVMSVPGALVIARLGVRRALLGGLALTVAAAALRGALPATAWLFAMTFLMSAGIAVMQPALPVLVQQWWPARVGFATAVYSNGLLAGEAIGAALTLPLALPAAGGSWRLCLALWTLPAVATLLLLLRTPPPGAAAVPRRNGPWWPDWRNGRTWQLGLVFGGASALYFGTNAFLPDYLHHLRRPDLVGPALTALNVSQLPASLLLLVTIERLICYRATFVAVSALALASVFGMMLLPADGVVAAAGVAGFCAASILILALALPARLADARDLHRLSAAMFTIAYGVAVIIPLLGGMLWDHTGVAAAVFLPTAAYVAAVTLMCGCLRLPAVGTSAAAGSDKEA